MSNKIYVGNLSFNTEESTIADVFARYGTVSSCKLITDRETGRSKGFAFVEMGSRETALGAISELDGRDFNGRTIVVNEAKPRVF